MPQRFDIYDLRDAGAGFRSVAMVGNAATILQREEIALANACLVRDSICDLIALLRIGPPDRVTQRWLLIPTILALPAAINGTRR
jgi:hypothetical protein